MFKIVVSDPQSRKTWQIEKDAPTFAGMKIGQKFDGSIVGLSGYTMEITGGSDKEGFPMRRDIDGVGRKKAFLIGGVGYKSRGKGVKKRRSVRGNTISDQVVQVNVKVAEKKQGAKPIAEALGVDKKEGEAPKEASKTEVKEEKVEEKKPEKPKAEEKLAEKKEGEEKKEESKSKEKPEEPKPVEKKKEAKEESVKEEKA